MDAYDRDCLRGLRGFTAMLAGILLMLPPHGQAAQFNIIGPVGSGQFGNALGLLPNGNIVVADPGFDAPGPVVDVGAVYLYSATGTLISTLTGSNAFDRVGSNGVTVLANGNYVVRSSFWNDLRGAVTWGSATTGVSGTVSAANSLVGGTASDQIGGSGITALANGNYLVRSQSWDATDPAVVNAGAVTWGDGASGVSGLVSASNSLVGSSASDNVGNSVTTLSNGHYLVVSLGWDDPAAALSNVGAVTWGNGSTGISGPINATNSLVGGSISDQVGSGGITELTNGHYVVNSPAWDTVAPVFVNVGAVTWADGNGGTVGLVSAANSLVGGGTGDRVGFSGVTALVNGNYVVGSVNWDDGLPAPAGFGAATWSNGNGGTVGQVSAANSLVGGNVGDGVGNEILALTNGHYVVASWVWDSTDPPVPNVGAVTWGNGNGGTVGLVTASNSLVGSTAFDNIGFSPTGGSGGITVLTNGHYVVRSRQWADGGVGAVTWGNGNGGTTGPINSANSLIGSTAGDGVGEVTALANGNYVVRSPNWDANGPAVIDAGAITWGDGNSGTVGAISAANSLIGGSANDRVGSSGITALANGNFVVYSAEWDATGPAVVDVGAVTWGDGNGGSVGLIGAANSLVGSVTNDLQITTITELTNSNYVVVNPHWNASPGAVRAGAVTWGNGNGGSNGPIGAANSLVGEFAESRVGDNGVIALADGNYVVASALWRSSVPVVSGAGAVTWGNGISGTAGPVSSTNSLVGGTLNDNVGNNTITALANGRYMMRSPSWNSTAPPLADSGAVTLGLSGGATTGLITSANSVLGATASAGVNLRFSYDSARERMVVGRPGDNIVTIFGYPISGGDELFANGFEASTGSSLVLAQGVPTPGSR